MSSVIMTIALILILIFIHELGHFLVGRFFGIAVDVFSIGFGPKLFSFNWRGVDYRLAMIPLGGYVRFMGVHPELEALDPSKDVSRELNGIPFCDASFTGRVLTIAAGPIANLVLAFVVYSGMAFQGIKYLPAFVGDVLQGTPAEKAGLQYGDIIKSIDGDAIESWEEVLDHISATVGGRKLQILIEREGDTHGVEVVPNVAEGRDRFGNPAKVGRIGISPSSLSAHVDVIPKSWVYQQGVRSGDQIVEVIAVDQKNLTVVTQSIVHWLQFKNFMENRAKLDAPVQIKVRAKDLREYYVVYSHDNERKKSTSGGSTEILEEIGFRSPDLLLKDGRTLVEFNGVVIRDRFEYGSLLENNTERKTILGLRSGESDEIVNEHVKVKAVDRQLPSGRVTVYVPELEFLAQASMPPLKVRAYHGIRQVLGYGVSYTAHQTGFLMRGLKELVTGGVPLQALGGPIMIAKVANDAAQAGWEVYFEFLALMSVNLAVINLFPIPATDGGQIMVNALEKIRRRRLSLKAIENFQKIGFTMIFFLIILATYNDLSRFWLGFLESVFSVQR